MDETKARIEFEKAEEKAEKTEGLNSTMSSADPDPFDPDYPPIKTFGHADPDLKKIDYRLEQIDKRIKRINKKLGLSEPKIDKNISWIHEIPKELRKIDEEIDNINKKIAAINQKINSLIEFPLK
jgi:uncharacterized protein YaaN involved in tellurite resistance